jgi:hypothetical protein
MSHTEFRISKICQDNTFTKNLLGLHGMHNSFPSQDQFWCLKECQIPFLSNPNSELEFEFIHRISILLDCYFQINFYILSWNIPNPEFKILFQNSHFDPSILAIKKFENPFPIHFLLLAQLALPAQLGPATHPSPTSSQNQRRRRRSTARAAMDDLPPNTNPPPPPLLLFKSCLNPPWWADLLSHW